MKIKLHNSLGKMDEDGCYIFDEKIFVRSLVVHLYLSYRIDDVDYFIKFSSDTKEFEKWSGFGENGKTVYTKWFKDPRWHWREMRK